MSPDAPAFVRFEAPFWFALDGLVAELNDEEVTATAEARYVGVVQPGSVAEVTERDERFGTVTVRLPAPWSEEHSGIPLQPEIITAQPANDGTFRVDVLNREQARAMFPGDFDAGEAEYREFDPSEDPIW